MTPPPPEDPNVLLSIDRTRLAYERTLMAWTRTAMSLITFGFTLYKLFDVVRAHGVKLSPVRWIGPRGFALLMIAMGTLGLIVATTQHRAALRELKAAPVSLAALLAVAITLLGLFLLVAVLLHL
jgi:putative membrane protein